MKRLLFMFLLTSSIFLAGCKEEMDNDIKLITAEEMQALMELEDVQLVDVRSAQERLDGFIKNSQNIDFNSPTFDQDILKLDRTKPVILYCHAGGQSSQCAEKLRDAGFEKIYDLQGGITQWRFKGYHLEGLH